MEEREVEKELEAAEREVRRWRRRRNKRDENAKLEKEMTDGIRKQVKERKGERGRQRKDACTSLK